MPDIFSSYMTETCSQPGTVQLSGLLTLTLEKKQRAKLLLFSGKEKESSGVLIWQLPELRVRELEYSSVKGAWAVTRHSL